MTTPSAARSALLAELEPYEHLLFEPMAQRNLDGLLKLRDTHLLDDPPLHCHTQAMTKPRTELIALEAVKLRDTHLLDDPAN
jgi:hypothetical protein